jgi:hypothetical protein
MLYQFKELYKNMANDFLSKIFNAKDLAHAKSIAEQARNNIFMYKVGISQSIGDVKLAVAINKYIETMCGIFTLIVSGINPIATKNSEIKDIIKSISAESFNTKSLLYADFMKTLSRMSVEYDFGNISDEKRYPRIGKNARSEEAPPPVILNSQGNPYNSPSTPSPETPSSTSSNQWTVDSRFAEKVEKSAAYPTIIKITFNISGGTITVPIAIKANPTVIGSEEMVMFIESTLAGRVYHFMRYFKWKSGEISTAQYLLGTDIAERDRKLYQSLGRNPIYMEFMKRKANSKFMGSLKYIFEKKQNIIGPTGSIVVTTDDLVNATKLDIRRFTRNNEFIQRIMNQTFIMCFGIVDLPMEVVNFHFMGYKEPFRINFAELGVGSNNLDSSKYLEQALLELTRKVA